MTNIDSFRARWTPRLLSVIRIILAFLFIPHGAQKLFGFMAPPQWSTPPIFSLVGVAGALEFFGGMLILLGLFTRPVAFILSGLMAVGYFMIHAPQGFWPLQNKGELAVIYCWLFLFLSVAGGGAWSLDRLFRRSRTEGGYDSMAGDSV
ncbi:MAG TPA: DoxX family protein [Pyrinomonadaceae bacterium]